ncbi:ABC transporter ATP-binding protein [Rhodococcus sp. NPDC003382]|uniref:ABC transporter ATP-binding protein n=1 Tax=unclassified Rhodococcus (in: high G+C Gram-positive bacteria) TaxID=192944 RepID=UPI0018CDA866|nr:MULTISPECIES: ABC transporter ATP-binding protein [unclassified Rhodococcus (in: high G+C Gram-positive bacteria)]MBH0118808.1 ABC transporter ATP-binding protein [Rhodococcus sp. CX]MCK8674020.1 ABC transporter ATP-binding protein [Rhodococcus sp. HM1]
MTRSVVDHPAVVPDAARPVKISARNLHKEFKNVGKGAGNGVTEVLDDFDLEIREGEFLSLLGPSGCGKSTFLNILAGLETFEGGELLLDGAPVRGVSKNIGVVFQNYALFPWLSVRKNVEAGLKIRGVPAARKREISERILTTVGLESFADHLPHRLSGGMRQRVAIARSLAYDPDVLVLDEPFAALDAQTREFLQGELLRIWESGARKKTILFVTHSIDEAIFLSDRIAVMSKRPGKVNALIEVDLPRPRNDDSRAAPEFGRIRAQVAQILKEEAHIGDR